MDPRFRAVYGELYRCHWWFRAREQFLVRWIAALAPAGGFGPILDIGCGEGFFFPALRRFGAPEGLERPAPGYAPTSPDGPIHLVPIDELAAPHPYGMILLLDVLEHVDDDLGLLAGAARHLAPGAPLLVTVPAFPGLWTEHDVINHHRRRYRRAELAGLAGRAGLAVEELRYQFAWLAPAKALERLRERLLGPPRDPIPRPSGAALTRALIALCRLERLVLPRPPFGSSLLMVARRAK